MRAMPGAEDPVGDARAVLLDAMGTLLRLEDPVPRLRAALRDRAGVDVGDAAAGEALRAEIAYYRAHHDEGRDADSLAALRRRCGEVVRAALPGGDRLDPDAVTAALLDALRFAPFPDAAPALDALRRRGARLVVVSNWDVSLHDALEATGLAGRLDGALSSAELGRAKPDPAIFEEALRRAGVQAGEAVHVGDSLEHDVAGARAAGIRPVLVARDGGPAPAGVAVVRSLAELVPGAP